MSTRDPDKNEIVVNYLHLRTAVGWVGSLLPVVLIAGNTIFTTTLPDSMSGYYYTHMRNVFVGALCALGVFLIAYAGYDEWDRWITNIAGLGAIGVAFCPTTPSSGCAVNVVPCPRSAIVAVSGSQRFVGDVHLCFAAIAFIALGVMALRFTKSDAIGPRAAGFMNWLRSALGLAVPGQPDARTPAKKRRDVIYRTCGLGILGCIVLAVLANLLPSSFKADVPVLFIFEALAVFAFGVSWYVKGETLLPAPLTEAGATQPAFPDLSGSPAG